MQIEKSSKIHSVQRQTCSDAMMGAVPVRAFADLSCSSGSISSKYDGLGPLCVGEELQCAKTKELCTRTGEKSYESKLVAPWFRVVEKNSGLDERSNIGTAGNKRRNSRREESDDGADVQILHTPAPLRRKLQDNVNGKVSCPKRGVHIPRTSVALATPIAASTADLEVQRIAGAQYQVGDLIGEGTYSKVYRVLEKGKNSIAYAMKVINKNNKKFMTSGKLYEKELRILQSCKLHPNVIRLHEVLRSVSHVCMVMELASGGDLLSRLNKNGRFTEVQSARTLKMILHGVAHLHQNGIVHRDLKLENLLYKTEQPDSEVVIIDFGLAHQNKTANSREQQQQQSSTEQCGCGGRGPSCPACSRRFFGSIGEGGMSTTCGTPEYLSPEMLDGEIYSAKVDLWAIGVITYALLSGRMPFSNVEGDGRGRAKMYQRIKQANFSTEDEVRLVVVVDMFALGLFILSLGKCAVSKPCCHEQWPRFETTAG